ncbi:MAG: GAF domain-containing protein [Thermodesulfobacteriota bacterium]
MEAHIKNGKTKELDVLARKDRYQDIISEVTQIVHQSIDLQSVLDNSIEAMVNNIDHMDNVSIYLVEDNHAVIKSHHGYTKDYLNRAGRIPYPKGSTWKAITEAKSLYIPDADKDKVLGQAGRDMGIKCYLIVPLFDEEKVVGTIIIVSREEKDVFDQEELKLLEIISKQISIAIRNAKQAQALSNSEERYRTLYQEGPAMYFTVNEKGSVLSVNRNAIEKLGYCEDELVGNSVFSVFPKDQRPIIKAQLKNCFKNPEQIFKWDSRKISKDGTLISVSELARSVIDAEGNKVAIIACEDTTESEKAKSLLIAEKEIMEAISQDKELSSILEQICLAVEEQADRMLCSILLSDNAEKYLIPGAAPNLPEDYLNETKLVPIGEGIGSCGTASYRKEQIIVSDIENDELWTDFCDLALRNNLGSCWSTPIVSKNGELLGTFATYYPYPKSPNENELEIIDRATHLARIAIERKKYQETKEENLQSISKKSRYEEIVSTVTRSVHQSIDIQKVINNSIEAMVKNIDKMDNISIYLVEGDYAVLKAHHGFTKDYLKRASKIQKPKGGIWRTIMDAAPRYCADTEQDNAIGQAGIDMGIKCYLVVPLFMDDNVIGTITIVSRETNAFEQEERVLLETVSKQIAIAIRNAQQAETLKRSEEDLKINLDSLSRKTRYEEVINAVARSVHRSLELNEVFDNAVEAISNEITEAKNVSIYMVQGDMEDQDNPPTAELKASRGHTKNYLNKVRSINYPKGATWRTIIDGKTRYVPDTDKDESIGPAGKEFGTKSYLSMPLTFNEKTVGCIHIHSTNKNEFSQDEIKLLEIVTAQLETAINNASKADALRKSEENLKENFEQLSKKIRYEEITSAVASSVHRSIDLNEVMKNAADTLSKNVNHADHVAIYLIEGDKAVLKSYTGYPEWFIDIVSSIPKPKGFTWKTLLEGEPHFVADVEKDKAIGPAGRKVGTKSYASMPIKHEGKTIGCINISAQTTNAFDKDEVKLLEIVATQIETAVNNANQAEALKRSREELSESREHYRLLVETTNVIPWEYNLVDNRFTYIGPQAQQLLGYTIQEWLTENFWLTHMHEDDRIYAKEACSALTQGSKDHELEYRMITKSGETVWLYEMASVIEEEQKPETLRGFIIDITEKKKAEFAKREVEERYKTIIEHSYDIIIETNVNGTFLYINPTFCDVLGYDQQELLGRSVFEHIHEDDAPETIRQFSFAINKFEKGSATYRFKHKSGGWRWLESVGSPFRTASGEIRTVISSRDITERMESEKKLQSAFEEIEELKNKLEKENIYLQKELELTFSHGDILGQSKAIRSALSKIEQVAATDATVMLTGETGTGKELFANRIHSLSERKDRAMVKVNCAALPPHLIESELFGHEKGAFTGAVAKSIGRFEVADGSTIFLDEVGELPLELQSKLLRVLQEGEFQRVGSSKTVNVNVRVITASNIELIEAVNSGNFREDLFYRLNVFPIHIPPLRERKEDIPDLLWFFISEFEEKMDKSIKNISRKDMENLINYPWPGNVRQLRNVIERAMILSTGPDLVIDLPGIKSQTPSEIKPIEDVERDHISYILNMTNWRIRGKAGAAEILGLKPTTLESRIKRLGIKRSH